jgi:anti-sigma-K factor RskA
MNSAPTEIELLNRLAAEYVLGTLRGPARRRVERWRTTSSLLDERCRFWEERLMPLLGAVRPVQPPAHLWEGIRARLGLPLSTRGGRGRLYALAASVLLVAALGTLLLWRTLAPQQATAVATIAAPSGTLMWQVEVYGAPGAAARLSVRAGMLAAPPVGRDYELWALPKGGGAPVSLGLLPYRHGAARRTLTLTQQRALASAGQLAVSIEPPGGSPTGQPTGAVVFVVPLRTVS